MVTLPYHFCAMNLTMIERSGQWIASFAIILTLLVQAALPAHATAGDDQTTACLLTNGNFDASPSTLDPWLLQANNGAQATLVAEANSRAVGNTSARINIGQVGPDAWNVQFSQQNVAMTLGTTYALSFWAKAQSGRTVTVVLQQPDPPFVSTWTTDVALTTNWQQFNFTIVYPWNAVTATPALNFDLGQGTGAVWLGDVSLCQSGNATPPMPAPTSPNCRVVNGDFEIGSLAPWAMTSTSSAQAIAFGDAGARSTTSAHVSISRTGTTEQDIRFEQANVAVTSLAWTSVQFYARSSKGQTVPVTLRGTSGQEYWRQLIRLPNPADDVAFKHFFFVFQMPSVAARSTATLAFNLGLNAGDVFIDAVHVCNAPIKFQDEFNGNGVDSTKWDQCKTITNQCAALENAQLMGWYKSSNAQVSGGTLKMLTTKETKTICFGCGLAGWQPVTRTYTYASVFMQTNLHFTTQYGFVEIRSKMPQSSSGLWPVHMMLPYVSPSGTLKWPPELDILEYFGYQPLWSWHTLHFTSATAFNDTDGRQYQHSSPLREAFHNYAVNWTPQEIIWYVDGMEVHRTTRYQVADTMYLVLCVDVGGLAGTPVDAQLPDTTEVDYVRIFDNGEAFAFNTSTSPTPTPTPTPNAPGVPFNPNVKARNYLPVIRTK